MAGRRTVVEQTMTEWFDLPDHPRLDLGVIKRDEELAKKMKDFNAATFGAAFVEFEVDDAAEFLRMVVPHKAILELWRRPSKFLIAFAEAWGASMDQWASALFLFCAKGCNLFGIAFSANRKIGKYSESDVGHALFVHLPKEYGDDVIAAVQSALGYMVKFVAKNQLVRVHEQKLYELTRLLPPQQVGDACRQLLLYRSRPESCKCGWFVSPRPGCTCAKNIEYDPLKEYAQALFYCVAQRRKGTFDDFDRAHGISKRLGADCTDNNWTDTETTEFLASACEDFFPEVAFNEICTTLKLSGSTGSDVCRPVLKRMRMLTDKETRMNYSGSFSQHSGCISRGCKVMPNFSCVNFACGKHCPKIGYLKCKVHKTKGFPMPLIDTEYPGGLEVLYNTEAGKASLSKEDDTDEVECLPAEDEIPADGLWDWS